ncbi:MAG TPA: glycosyltransferase [Rhodopila sp.]
MLFDEAWHRRAYPAMAALVEAGHFPSAFDAYCRGGCLERSPHWLFDESAYRRACPDLTDAAMAKQGLVNGYDHYLWRGNAECRIAHPLFDPAVYLTQLPPREAEAAADGPFWHYLRRLDRREPEVRTSADFDPAWYRERYPDVAAAIGDRTWRCALEHYLCNDTPTLFDPSPAFSEACYLSSRPDVAAMVADQQFRNGYAHFLRHGTSSADDAQEEDLQPGFAASPPDRPPATGQQRLHMAHDRARTLSVLTARTRLNFGMTSAPALSVIIVLHNQLTLALTTLGSLRANDRDNIELILVDSGSTDETRYIARYVSGATCLRFDTDIGTQRGRSAGFAYATADTVLYLNASTELAPGAIAAALRRMATDPRIGAVGGMILRPDNVIEEAGSIVWPDGSTEGYMCGASPLAPEANFVRDVDFCSGTFLMTRRGLLNMRQGPEEALVPAGYNDVDLCIGMRQAGYRVVYDPAVVAIQLEDGGAHLAAPAETSGGRADLAANHASRPPHRRDTALVFARTADASQRRVLFLEDTVPLRVIGSGFVRSNDLVRTMASIGYAVTVYPLDGCRFDLAQVFADMPDTVEVMHDHAMEQLLQFLTLRLGYYDAIWIARTHNLDTVCPILQQAAPGAPPLVVLDTQAIASLRQAGHAALMRVPFDVNAAIAHELRNAGFPDKIVAATETEAATLRDRGFADVTVIGHTGVPHPTPRPFARRAGMLLIGATHGLDRPNYDGLCWFVDEVMPLIEQELGWQTRLTVVGHTGTGVGLERFCDHPRITLLGAVPDPESLYDSHRVFVAPTRFAAGAPHQIYEAVSFGLPVVTTSLLRRQLGWVHDQELLTADGDDPGCFAHHVVAVQRDETCWQRLRAAAWARLEAENNQQTHAAAIAAVLGPPLS